jgi:hypothetical protein
MAVNSNLGRRMNQQILLVIDNPVRPAAQVIQQGVQGCTPHFEGIVLIPERQPALLVEVLNLIGMNEGVCVKDRCPGKDLSCPIQRKTTFQIPFDVLGNLLNEVILAVFQDGDLILAFLYGFILIVLIRNESLIRNNGADAFIRFLSPVPAGKFDGMVGVDVVMTTDLFDFRAGPRTELPDVFRNGTRLPRHGSSLLVLIGNIYNNIVSQKAEKCNRKMLIQLYFSTGFWLLDHLPKLRPKAVNSLIY